MPGKFLALGLVHWGQPGFLVVASPRDGLGAGPEGLSGLTCGPMPPRGSWAVGEGVTGHRLIAIVVQPENSLDRLCLCPENTPPCTHPKSLSFGKKKEAG